jgi:hypothetical protein
MALVWGDHLPISHIEHIDITSNIDDTQNATQDSVANPLSPIFVRDPAADSKPNSSTASAELSTRTDTRLRASVNPSSSHTFPLPRGNFAPAELEPLRSEPLFSAEVRQLFQRAESLRSASVTEGPQITELQRRLRELGSPEEVLQALQGIFRMDNEVDAALPEYEEGSRRRD